MAINRKTNSLSALPPTSNEDAEEKLDKALHIKYTQTHRYIHTRINTHTHMHSYILTNTYVCKRLGINPIQIMKNDDNENLKPSRDKLKKT